MAAGSHVKTFDAGWSARGWAVSTTAAWMASIGGSRIPREMVAKSLPIASPGSQAQRWCRRRTAMATTMEGSSPAENPAANTPLEKQIHTLDGLVRDFTSHDIGASATDARNSSATRWQRAAVVVCGRERSRRRDVGKRRWSWPRGRENFLVVPARGPAPYHPQPRNCGRHPAGAGGKRSHRSRQYLPDLDNPAGGAGSILDEATGKLLRAALWKRACVKLKFDFPWLPRLVTNSGQPERDDQPGNTLPQSMTCTAKRFHQNPWTNTITAIVMAQRTPEELANRPAGEQPSRETRLAARTGKSMSTLMSCAAQDRSTFNQLTTLPTPHIL